MKKIIIILSAICLTSLNSYAEIIKLKSGEIIEGDISEQTDDAIRVTTNTGMEVTYYRDEIENIEGQFSGGVDFDVNINDIDFQDDLPSDIRSENSMKKQMVKYVDDTASAFKASYGSQLTQQEVEVLVNNL